MSLRQSSGLDALLRLQVLPIQLARQCKVLRHHRVLLGAEESRGTCKVKSRMSQ